MFKAFARYADEVAVLSEADTTREETYYPAIRSLLLSVLDALGLPFDVRTTTSERRVGGGIDSPDLALYDAGGEFLAVCGEVKPPDRDLAEMAGSIDRNDQLGRYLAQTRVVLLSNVRGFALLTTQPDAPAGPVGRPHRRLEHHVELWPSTSAMRQGRAIPSAAQDQLVELVETAVTRFASIAEPESLARILARQARRAKAALPRQFSHAVQDLLDDFGKALGITFQGHDGEEFIRSSLIQTAYYGLFAGWALWRRSGVKKPFQWAELSEYLRIPFLGELFHEFRHPARIRELDLARHLDIATETLDRVDTERFFARFLLPTLDPTADSNSGREQHASAITYFYEPFLEAFDPELRKELGVWYTPWEIVRYQVRKVDRILRDELGCERGLADPRVVVADLCCGTGAYVLETLRCIAEQLHSEGVEATLGAELLDAACRRVIGFEVLTAPFVIAQLQAYLLLSDLGATPTPKHRPAIYLTNALTGWERGADQLKLHFPELQQEHDAARSVKRSAKIIVIIGNPPYNRFAGAAVAEEADLVDHYKGIHRNANGKQLGTSSLWERFGVRKQLLDDLYVRFLRLAERQIGERAEHGIVSYISNSSYLVGRSHPLMRESLLKTFSSIWIDNLNGDKYRTGKVIPKGLPGEGTSDQSAFTTDQDQRGIQVGTAISTLLKHPGRMSGTAPTLHYRDFWGRAHAKRRALLESLEADNWPQARHRQAATRPEGPRAYEHARPTVGTLFRFAPEVDASGFESWPALDDLFPTSYQGINPNRGLEGSVVDINRDALEVRMKDYFSPLNFRDFAVRHPVLAEDRARYVAQDVRDVLRRATSYEPHRVRPYLTFPLDSRWLYYEDKAKLLNERRPDLWENLSSNYFLLCVPQSRRVSESRPLVTDALFDLHVHDRGSAAFSAFVTRKTDLFAATPTRHANLAEPVWAALKAHWSLKGDLTGEPAAKLVLQLFHLALAVGHAPAYHADHQEALAQDWLHLPIPRERKILERAAGLGAAVATLIDPHRDATRVLRDVLGSDARALAVLAAKGGRRMAESDLLVEYSFYGASAGSWRSRPPVDGETVREAWGSETGDLWLNSTVYLRHVPAKVWKFELGGYPVLKKWLGYREAKRRNGQPLALAEAQHLRSMAQRIAALLALEDDLNATYTAVLEDCFTSAALGLE